MIKEDPRWEKFPTNKVARNKLLADAEKYVRDEVAPYELSWGAMNSPLRESPKFVRGFSFESTFRSVIPTAEKNLKTYIEDTLRQKAGQAIGIEFGGPGSELFAGFSKGFFNKTAGICLNESRDLMRPDTRARDEERHHELIVGNIFNDETYKKLDVWLNGEKADVIFERLLGGLMYVPQEPHLLGTVLSRWYDVLGGGGMLFVEIPRDFSPFVVAWELTISNQNIQGLEFDSGRNRVGDKFESFPMRIRKLTGAPEKLPLLDMKMVTSISQGLKPE